MLFNKFVNGENGTDVIPQKKLWDKLIHVIKVKKFTFIKKLLTEKEIKC